MFNALSCLSAFSVLLVAGCLGDTYAISKRELGRLAQLAPASRGASVRVTQQLGESFADAPPLAEGHAPWVVEGQVDLLWRGPAGPGPYGPGGYRRLQVTRAGPHGASTVKTPPGSGRAQSGARGRGGGTTARGGTGGGSGSGSGGNSGSGGDIGDLAGAAAVVVAVATVAGIALAATEGARFDGWARLGSTHPVHLIGPKEEHRWVPLNQLGPSHAEWAKQALVSPVEGLVVELQRAPLDRKGWAYAVELGASQLSTLTRGAPWGFASHIVFGGFPLQQLGILGGTELAWGQNSLGFDVLNARLLLEAQVLPLRLTRLHAGVYGQGGYDWLIEESARGTAARGSGFLGAGALLQLDVTTRLALTMRTGFAAPLRADGGQLVPSVMAGFAVY
ncbi:MAG: hypothetical protein IPG96_15430 [Proteobacteria bacterium]|nr:hypothetical protein [Pseudomonadota bacterium]